MNENKPDRQRILTVTMWSEGAYLSRFLLQTTAFLTGHLLRSFARTVHSAHLLCSALQLSARWLQSIARSHIIFAHGTIEIPKCVHAADSLNVNKHAFGRTKKHVLNLMMTTMDDDGI